MIRQAFYVPFFRSPVQQSNKEVYFSYNGSPCDLEAKNTSISFLVVVNGYSPRWKLIVKKYNQSTGRQQWYFDINKKNDLTIQIEKQVK